jgi:polygalacturonase
MPGAVGNGIADDTAAINRTIAAGTTVYFPPGTYKYIGPMTLPANKSYRIYGDGPGVSTILFTGPNAGINGSSIGVNTFNVEGLTLTANSTDCGTAIRAVFSESGTATKFRTASIHNVQIIGNPRSDPSGGYWTGGVYLYKAQNSVIDKLEMTGNVGPTSGAPTQTGIVWESSNDYATSGLEMTNIEIKFVNTALRASGWVEGLYLTGFEFVLCGQLGMPAVDLSSFDSSNQKSAFHLVNGHVDCMEEAVRLTNLRGAKITKVTFAHASTAAVPATIVEVNNCVDVVVSECTFFGVGGNVSDENGILLDNSHFVRIARNYFDHMLPGSNGNCIVVFGTDDAVRITDNVFNSVRSPYYDKGPDTYYWGNNL